MQNILYLGQTSRYLNYDLEKKQQKLLNIKNDSFIYSVVF